MAAEPRAVRELITSISRDPGMNDGIVVVQERESEYPNKMAARLVGIASSPAARRHFDRTLDERWSKSTISEADEVIIGGGFHAAVYAAIRVANGFPRPLVLEESQHAGGTFAMSSSPAFFLNSRNRPGDLGIPGNGGALNVLPGAPIQPAHLSSDEYQRNSDVAFVVRATLAMNADVRTGVKVNSIQRTEASKKYRYRLSLAGGAIVRANRVIVATGIGKERRFDVRHDRIVTFSELMERMDGHYPLQGLSRVAVIGNGDSGRAAVEALTGQGPNASWSTAALDYVELIDWYGLARVISATSLGIQQRVAWEGCNRSRYKGIGRLFTGGFDGTSRIKPRLSASAVSGGFGVAYVDERPYDLVVDCRGYERDSVGLPDDSGIIERAVNGRTVGRFDASDGAELFLVGPAAELPIGSAEQEVLPVGVPENSTALFRYSARTAALAAELRAPSRPQVIAAAPQTNGDDARPVLLNDADGNPLRAGDLVSVINSTPSNQGLISPILGPVDGRDAATIYALGPPIAMKSSSSYTFNGDNVYGAEGRELRRVAVGGVALGLDLNGSPIFSGDIVTAAGYSDCPVLGLCDGDTTLIAIGGKAVAYGGSKFQGTTVYGSRPGAVIVSTSVAVRNDRLRVLAKDRDGFPIRIGDKVESCNGDAVSGYVFAFKDGKIIADVGEEDGIGRGGFYVNVNGKERKGWGLSPVQWVVRPLGADIDGKPIFVGDRLKDVRITAVDGNVGFAYGVAKTKRSGRAVPAGDRDKIVVDIGDRRDDPGNKKGSYSTLDGVDGFAVKPREYRKLEGRMDGLDPTTDISPF